MKIFFSNLPWYNFGTDNKNGVNNTVLTLTY